MQTFLLWYLISTLLGLVSFPLVYALTPALASRGYAIARPAGLLVWSYLFWLMASLGIAQNNWFGIVLAAGVLAAVSARIWKSQGRPIASFLRVNWQMIAVTEILFLAAFVFMAAYRSANPELSSTEKPMELAFINGILRSETFPPRDPWLSGHSISYYYFGYVMTAMLAKITGAGGSLAHNLMTSLVYALSAAGALGILVDLLAKTSNAGAREKTRVKLKTVLYALFAPVFLLLMSNFETLLEVLHRRGIFWKESLEVTGIYTSNFWSWLDIQDLATPPAIPFGAIPDRFYWWWRASRVVRDYDLLGRPLEVINEFPFFSFLLGDLHPHVLAIPFVLLCIALAYNLYSGGMDGKSRIAGIPLFIRPAGFWSLALVLGGLAFINTWDILFGTALVLGAYALRRVEESSWSWERIKEVIFLALPLSLAAILLYLPFHLSFSSQASGVLPNFMTPTRGAHLWVVWGTLLIPIFAFLVHLAGRSLAREDLKRGALSALIAGAGLALVTLLVGLFLYFTDRAFVDAFLAGQGVTLGEFMAASSLRRLAAIGAPLTMLALLALAAGGLLAPYNPTEGAGRHRFPLLLLALGAGVVLAPDFVFLRDQFGYRINTVFKFYYHGWILFSLAAAYSSAVLLQSLDRRKKMAFGAVLSLVVAAGLLYPFFGLKTLAVPVPSLGRTLDDFDRFKLYNPDESAAIEFLRSAPDGVIAEAVGDSYTPFGRIAMHTGLPSVLNWPGHEAQWRGGYEAQGTRRDDIQRLYTTASWEEARAIMDRYRIRYIVVGLFERNSMPVQEDKFAENLKEVFRSGPTVIYADPAAR